jgi:hypothetical protein
MRWSRFSLRSLLSKALSSLNSFEFSSSCLARRELACARAATTPRSAAVVVARLYNYLMVASSI